MRQKWIAISMGEGHPHSKVHPSQPHRHLQRSPLTPTGSHRIRAPSSCAAHPFRPGHEGGGPQQPRVANSFSKAGREMGEGEESAEAALPSDGIDLLVFVGLTIRSRGVGVGELSLIAVLRQAKATEVCRPDR